MRKRARGSTQSASEPTPQPIPTTATKTSCKMLCISCNKQPAKALLIPNDSSLKPFFCSHGCAAAFGVHVALCRRYLWCEKHENWSSLTNTCTDCFAEEEAARRDACIQVVNDQADGKAVPNG